MLSILLLIASSGFLNYQVMNILSLVNLSLRAQVWIRRVQDLPLFLLRQSAHAPLVHLIKILVRLIPRVVWLSEIMYFLGHGAVDAPWVGAELPEKSLFHIATFGPVSVTLRVKSLNFRVHIIVLLGVESLSLFGRRSIRLREKVTLIVLHHLLKLLLVLRLATITSPHISFPCRRCSEMIWTHSSTSREAQGHILALGVACIGWIFGSYRPPNMHIFSGSL